MRPASEYPQMVADLSDDTLGKLDAELRVTPGASPVMMKYVTRELAKRSAERALGMDEASKVARMTKAVEADHAKLPFP